MECGFCGGTKQARYCGWRLGQNGEPERYSFLKPCPRCNAQQSLYLTACAAWASENIYPIIVLFVILFVLFSFGGM